MTNILLSIKPEYAGRIYARQKRYEYRKALPKRLEILGENRILLYETAPVKLVTGWFRIASISSGTPKAIWDGTNEFAGISGYKYFLYYKDSQAAFAFKVDEENIHRFDTPIPIESLGLKRPPQSYAYIPDEKLQPYMEAE